MSAILYTEAFVEKTGWRWRIYQSDPGLIHIQYQEWDESTRTWHVPSNGEGGLTFGVDESELICSAIQQVSKESD